MGSTLPSLQGTLRRGNCGTVIESDLELFLGFPSILEYHGCKIVLPAGSAEISQLVGISRRAACAISEMIFYSWVKSSYTV